MMCIFFQIYFPGENVINFLHILWIIYNPSQWHTHTHTHASLEPFNSWIHYDILYVFCLFLSAVLHTRSNKPNKANIINHHMCVSRLSQTIYNRSLPMNFNEKFIPFLHSWNVFYSAKNIYIYTTQHNRILIKFPLIYPQHNLKSAIRNTCSANIN